MVIRKGTAEDLTAITDILKDAIMDMESNGIYQWDDIYPNMDVIKNDIHTETLYVLSDKAEVKGFIVLNSFQDKEYEIIPWKYNAGIPLVIHRLCINPKYLGKGFASSLLKFTENHGKKLKYESIRLDAFSQNNRACKLYENKGYENRGTLSFRKGEFICFEKKL